MSKIPSIGEMRQVIKFEKPVKQSDGSGGTDEQFEDWFTCRGCLTRKSGKRAFEVGYDEVINDYDLFVPWRSEIESDITKDVQVVFEGRTFSVVTWERPQEERRVYHFELKELA